MNSNMVCIHTIFFLVVACLTVASHGSAIRSQPASHLMIDFNWPPQPDFKIRKYPHEKYCHYFYNWESGDLYTIRKCPKGEMFDYHSHECKEKKEAQCWNHRYGKTKGHDHIHTKLKNHFDCPFSSGKYPDVFVCEKYFVCKDGVSHQKHCPPTKLFDRIRRQCVDESVALCADITDADDIHHRCPKPSGTFGDSKDCSKYYTCKHGAPSKKKCPEGELFNDVEKYCSDNDVQCGNRSNPYNQVSTSNEETSTYISSTLPDSEIARNLSKSDLNITSKTDTTESNSEPVTSSAVQTSVSEIKESSTIASKELSTTASKDSSTIVSKESSTIASKESSTVAIIESSTSASKESNKDDHKETKANDKSISSTNSTTA